MYNCGQQGVQHSPIDRISGQIPELAPAQSRQVKRARVEGLNAKGFRRRQVPQTTPAFINRMLPSLHVPVRTRQGAYKGAVTALVNLYAPPTPPPQVGLPFNK